MLESLPSREKPADLSSRGLTPMGLAANQLWKCGPGWLKTPKPLCMRPSLEEISEPWLSEMKASSKVGVHSLLTPQLPHHIGNIIDVKRFSFIYKLLCVTTYILKFVSVLKGRSETPRGECIYFFSGAYEPPRREGAFN